MTGADRPKMYELTGCFDPNSMAEAATSQRDAFPQTVTDPPPPITVDELAYNHHNPPLPEDISAFANGIAAIASTSMEITQHPQPLGLNMANSFNNNNNMGTHLVPEVIDVLPYHDHEHSAWDPSVQELQDTGYANNHDQQPHDQQFHQMEAQNCGQSFNSSSILDPPPYPSSDLLNLLHLPRCSSSSLLTNPSICIPNPTHKTSHLQNSMGFLGELPIGADSAIASSVFYDPLFHLNLPPQPPAFRELFQSLPHGYSLPTSSRNGSLLGVADDIEANGIVYQDGDGSQLDIGVLEFNKGTASIGKGREGKGTKHFATEKQRREQLNGKYQVLRSLIPHPTKIDRASVVGDAIEYIRELIRTVNELKLLVAKKRHGREKCKRHRTEDDAAESCNVKPFADPDGCIRTSWLQRKSKDTEVDVRIIDDEVTIKLVQRKKINCLLYVSKVLDELQLDLHHVAGGHVGEYCSFLFNSKICEGSSVYASAIANKVIEVMDRKYAAAIPTF